MSFTIKLNFTKAIIAYQMVESIANSACISLVHDAMTITNDFI